MSDPYEHRFASVVKRLDTHDKQIQVFQEHVIRCDERQEQRLKEEREDRAERLKKEEAKEKRDERRFKMAIVVVVGIFGLLGADITGAFNIFGG